MSKKRNRNHPIGSGDVTIRGSALAAHDETEEARIGAHIQPQPNGCWYWNGDGANYGVLRAHGEYVKAHRYVYDLLAGPIPEGKVLHHECEHPGCCNPEHLTPMDNGEHVAHHAALRKAG